MMSKVSLQVIAEGRARRLMALKDQNIVADLLGGRVVIWDPKMGFNVFTAGFFGKPVGIRKPKLKPFDAPLELSLYEALYLLEKGVIKVRMMGQIAREGTTKIRVRDGEYLSPEELIELGNLIYKDFSAKYKVYKDLRDKGYVVRPGLKFGSDFAVYRYGPGIDHAPFLVTVFSSDIRLLGIDFVRAGRLANSVRKRWVIATILRDGSIRYFIFTWHRL